MSMPASFNSFFENKGVFPNSVILASIGTFKFSENFLYWSISVTASVNIASAPAST